MRKLRSFVELLAALAQPKGSGFGARIARIGVANRAVMRSALTKG